MRVIIWVISAANAVYSTVDEEKPLVCAYGDLLANHVKYFAVNLAVKLRTERMCNLGLRGNTGCIHC